LWFEAAQETKKKPTSSEAGTDVSGIKRLSAGLRQGVLHERLIRGELIVSLLFHRIFKGLLQAFFAGFAEDFIGDRMENARRIKRTLTDRVRYGLFAHIADYIYHIRSFPAE
jgi:hypothetical protein